MIDDDGAPPSGGFDERLRSARAREASRQAPAPGSAASVPKGPLGVAFRIGVELVAALVVGVGIGWLLDMWLGTRPWFMVVFFFLGSAAGMLNVYRAMRGLGYAPGYAPRDGKE